MPRLQLLKSLFLILRQNKSEKRRKCSLSPFFILQSDFL